MNSISDFLDKIYEKNPHVIAEADAIIMHPETFKKLQRKIIYPSAFENEGNKLKLQGWVVLTHKDIPKEEIKFVI